MEVRQVQLVRKLCSGGIQWFLFWQVDHWLPPESNGNLAGQFRAGFRVVVPMQTTGNETTEITAVIYRVSRETKSKHQWKWNLAVLGRFGFSFCLCCALKDRNSLLALDT